MSGNSFLRIMPFFIVIIIDAVGLGMVAPLLAPLIVQSHGFLGSDPYTQHLLYGLILAIFPLSYMIGAPFLGILSDYWGRKKVLLICLLGALCGFIFYALSFAIKNVMCLMIARGVAGLASGSQGVAQAAMADVSLGHEKTINMGIIAVAMTLGLFGGPLLAGILSNPDYISWFALTTPFYFVIILSACNLIYLHFFVQDQFQIKSNQENILTKKNFSTALYFLTEKKLRLILFLFFLFELGWSLYFQSLALFLARQFHYETSEIGFFSTYVGLALCFGLIFMVRFAVRRYHSKDIIRFSLISGSIALFSLFVFQKLFFQYFLALPVTMVVAVVYSCLISSASDAVSQDFQGLLMGVTDSILAFAFAITGFLSGWLAYFSIGLPFLFSGIFWFSAGIMAKLFLTHRKEDA